MVHVKSIFYPSVKYLFICVGRIRLTLLYWYCITCIRSVICNMSTLILYSSNMFSLCSLWIHFYKKNFLNLFATYLVFLLQVSKMFAFRDQRIRVVLGISVERRKLWVFYGESLSLKLTTTMYLSFYIYHLFPMFC